MLPSRYFSIELPRGTRRWGEIEMSFGFSGLLDVGCQEISMHEPTSASVPLGANTVMARKDPAKIPSMKWKVQTKSWTKVKISSPLTKMHISICHPLANIVR